MNMATNIKNLPILVALIISIGTVCATANVVADTQDLGGTSDAHGKAEPTTTKAERLVHPTGKPPFPYKDLGANWQYANDKDKLPLIRAAFTSGRLRKYAFEPDDNPICKTFPYDFINGNFKVIKPKYEALSDDYLLLGRSNKQRVTSSISDENNHKGLPNWHLCDGASPSDSTATDPSMVFLGLYAYGEPPYRIYRTNGKNGTTMDIALVRENNNLKPPKWKVDGYGQDYFWVDLKGCEIFDAIQVLSPKAAILDGLHQDSVSLLIQYKGQPLVLGYANWAKIGEPKSLQVSVSGFHKGGKSYCEWVYPGAFTKK